MKIAITGNHMEVGDAFTNHIESKGKEIIGKYFDHPIDVQITLTKENHRVISDISAHVGKGITVRGGAENGEPYQAFDEALHKLESSLRRYKSRLRTHHHKHQQQEKRAFQYVLSSDYRNFEVVEKEESLNPSIVAEMSTEIPHLTVSEAVMRMDLANKTFLLFYNNAHGGLNLVHLRKDGNIGWIDPDGTKMMKKA